jgi:hypothetical protein
MITAAQCRNYEKYDTWDSDNSTDEDIDEISDEDRREPPKPTKPTHAPKTQARCTQSDAILQDIQYLTDIYGQAPEEDAKPIPYVEAAKLFQKVKTWAQTRVLDAYKRVEKAVKTIKEAANKL